MQGLNAWTDWLAMLRRVLGVYIVSPKRAWENKQQEQVDADYERLDGGGDCAAGNVDDSEREVSDGVAH